MKQRPLFNELPMALKKLTDEDIERLAIKHFGNMFYYYQKEITKFARSIKNKIEGINK